MTGAGVAALGAAAAGTMPLLPDVAGLKPVAEGVPVLLAPYRPLCIGLAAGALVWAVHREWRLARNRGCACTTGLPTGIRRALLAAGILAVAVLAVLPSIAGARSGKERGAVRGVPAHSQGSPGGPFNVDPDHRSD